ncbi:MAG: hypothetical protein ACJASX_001524 [Limisphaerales bacterium]
MKQKKTMKPDDDQTDRDLRAIATGVPHEPLIGELGNQVIARVVRRRKTIRGIIGSGVIAALVVGFLIFQPAEPIPQQASRIETPNPPTSTDAGIPRLLPADQQFLAAPPPVINLAVIADDRSALLAVLHSLETEAP